jgi:hypothetical protein
MSKETKEDLVLLIITSVTSAIGMTSVFVDCRLLAWIAILVSDAYIFLVLLLAAILSEDDAFATRRPWISGFFPSRTGALFVFPLLFLSIVSGFAGLYVGAEVFQSSKTSVDATDSVRLKLKQRYGLHSWTAIQSQGRSPNDHESIIC